MLAAPSSRIAAPAAIAAALCVALAAALASCAAAGDDDFGAKVVRIRDGDSVDVLRGSETIQLRLWGVDCPERGQPWSAQAKQLTARLAGNHEVVVRVKDHDTYGRTVAEVILPDGRNLGQELVRGGLAWHYRRYSNDATLAALEAEARAARRGLWGEADPVPPWEFRHDGRGRGNGSGGGPAPGDEPTIAPRGRRSPAGPDALGAPGSR